MNQLQKALSEPHPAERVCKLLDYLQELERDRADEALVEQALYALNRATDQWRVKVGIPPVSGSGTSPISSGRSDIRLAKSA